MRVAGGFRTAPSSFVVLRSLVAAFIRGVCAGNRIARARTGDGWYLPSCRSLSGVDDGIRRADGQRQTSASSLSIYRNAFDALKADSISPTAVNFSSALTIKRRFSS